MTLVPDLTFGGFLNLLCTKLILPSGWGIGQPQFLCQHRATWRYRKSGHSLILRTEFQRLTPIFETYKAANALDDSTSATWILILFEQIVVVVVDSLARSKIKFFFHFISERFIVYTWIKWKTSLLTHTDEMTQLKNCYSDILGSDTEFGQHDLGAFFNIKLCICLVASRQWPSSITDSHFSLKLWNFLLRRIKATQTAYSCLY